MIGGTAQSRAVGRPQIVQESVIPAPLQGMDARSGIAVDNQAVCLWAINMVPSEYGMRTRSGYREWQVGLGNEARTVITYNGHDGSPAVPDRIFTATQTGIYDTTVAEAAPVLKLTFTTSSTKSGRGVWTHYVDEAGNDTIFYADEENGLFRYDPSTDTWAQATGITAIAGSLNTLDVKEIVFVVVHKLRIWLVTKGAEHAWYLPIRSATGEAREFFFGSKFRLGGELVGLFNWTVDGGNGRDDHLVSVSRGGDVIPYTGEDPSDAMTWTSTGTFHIGAIPSGNRIASEYGGELFLLSTLGVTTMSDLLRGGNPEDPFRNQIGFKVARLMRQDMDIYRDDPGWTMRFITNEGLLIIAAPERIDGTYRQYVYNLSTQGWGLWRGVPLLSLEPWEGKLMIGTKDGRVLRMDVELDDIKIGGTGGTAVDWLVLTSYSTLGSPSQHKVVHFVRPNFVSDREPQYQVHAYYDYRVDTPPPISVLPETSGSLWDVGKWDEDIWASTQLVPWAEARGTAGTGRAVAVMTVGASFAETFIASWDVSWEVGGFL